MATDKNFALQIKGNYVGTTSGNLSINGEFTMFALRISDQSKRQSKTSRDTSITFGRQEVESPAIVREESSEEYDIFDQMQAAESTPFDCDQEEGKERGLSRKHTIENSHSRKFEEFTYLGAKKDDENIF